MKTYTIPQLDSLFIGGRLTLRSHLLKADKEHLERTLYLAVDNINGEKYHLTKSDYDRLSTSSS